MGGKQGHPTLPDGWSAWQSSTTAFGAKGYIVQEEGVVYCPQATGTDGKSLGAYYTNLEVALADIAVDEVQGAVLYCKPGANVTGASAHAPLTVSVTIHGNDAYMTTNDLDIDTYTNKSFSWDKDGSNGTTGDTVKYDSALSQDITVNITALDGVAAWGERKTSFTINLSFTDCQDMNRVYFSGTTGTNNFSFDGCSFGGAGKSTVRTAGACTIYSNAAGTISVKNSTFNFVAVPINLNHESTGGTQTLTVEGCTFTDCATKSSIAAASGTNAETPTYAAPIRVMANVSTNGSALTVANCVFTYTTNEVAVNGDILIGEGRYGKSGRTCAVKVDVSGTAATVEVHESGHYNSDYTENASLVWRGSTAASETMSFTTVNGHYLIEHDAVAATCTQDGTEQYYECGACGKLFSDAAATTAITSVPTISALGHNYGAAVWAWSSDHTSATVSKTCSRDSSHVITAIATVTSSTSGDATTYTATAELGGATLSNSLTVPTSSETSDNIYVPEDEVKAAGENLISTISAGETPDGMTVEAAQEIKGMLDANLNASNISVEYVLRSDAKDAEDIGSAEAELIDGAATAVANAGETTTEYFDVSAMVRVTVDGDSCEASVTEVPFKAVVTLTLNESLNGKVYSVVHVHEGTAIQLAEGTDYTLSEDGLTLTVTLSKFSTIAVVSADADGGAGGGSTTTTETSVTTTTTSPQTGDNSIALIAVAAIAVVAAAGAALALRHRKQL